MARKPKYQRIEQEDLKILKFNKSVKCPSCKNKQEIGSMKGSFNCPDCGWELHTKDAE